MNKKYFVYRYLDKDNNIIYVGLTSRPLKERVIEHKVEELNSCTAKIQYIIVPNEARMRMRERYYINLYKPKYNKRDVYDGLPEPMPEYDSKWINYPKNGDIKQIEWIIDTLFDEFFNDKRFPYFVSIATNRNRIGCISNRIMMDNGILKNEIIVNEADLFSNDKRMLVDIVAQIIQIFIRPMGIRASNRNIYINKKVAKYLHEYGIVTQRSKYGYEPINCDDKYIKEFSQYEYGKSNIQLYTPDTKHTLKNGIKKSSTRKYICPCCGNSFRATKNINVMCMDCNEQYVIDKNCKSYIS
jgi:hypothetical protein